MLELIQLSVNELLTKQGEQYKVPFFSSLIPAGFPSPADDFLEKRISMDELLIQNADATYFFRVLGNSMKEAGIFHHDILIVDIVYLVKILDFSND